MRVLIAAALLTLLPAAADAALPKPTGAYINDWAAILSPEAEQRLDALVKDVEKQTTAEIAVVTTLTLDGMEVEPYATALFNAWGIGKKGKDNGVLVLVAPGQRAMRIEVGYGLEGILPDGMAGAIIRTSFLPRFREDQYERGIVEGVERVAAVVRRNRVLTAEQIAAFNAPPDAGGPIVDALAIVLRCSAIAIGFWAMGFGFGGRQYPAAVLGFPFGVFPLLGEGPFFLSWWLLLFAPLAWFVPVDRAGGARGLELRVGPFELEQQLEFQLAFELEFVRQLWRRPFGRRRRQRPVVRCQLGAR